MRKCWLLNQQIWSLPFAWRSSGPGIEKNHRCLGAMLKPCPVEFESPDSV
jgi:hypothetical protein